MLQRMRREGVTWLIANQHAALWDGMTVGQLASSTGPSNVC